ncbi:MAG TPA: 50S ribosomal protein L11 [Blattabacteriaceae bacterium]
MTFKKVIKRLRIEKIIGGSANPSPPVGPILGSSGVNIMEFCKQFNCRTKERKGQICPVVIFIYDDKSFDFVIKKPPVSLLLKEAVKLKKGSKEPNRFKIGEIDWNKVKKIAEIKMSDLNCFTLKSAMSMIKGTARSMGIDIN